MKNFQNKRIIATTILAMVIMFTACVEDESVKTQQKVEEEMVSSETKSGVLTFASPDDFSRQMQELREADSFEIPMAKTRAVSTDFVSLREQRIADVMATLTPEQIQEAENDGLVYEPEDDYISDPFLMSVLNFEREVLVGDKMYRYVEDGLIEYVPTPENVETVNTLTENGEFMRTPMSHGQELNISSDIKFIAIEYAPLMEEVSGEAMTRASALNEDGSLTLMDGIHIPSGEINKVTYANGAGSGSWLQKTISDMFGTNVTIDNYFDKKHRMKLRMYEQDYIVYRAIGMTVRMQHRRFGIWWRRKADEFRYGWTAIEVAYEYKNPPFPKLQLPQGMSPSPINQYAIPATMQKKFPYAKTDIILFRAASYDVTSGDVNKLFNAGIKQVASVIQSYVNQKPEHKDSPKGLYKEYDDYKKIAVVFPQGEDVAWNDGREVVRWDQTWLPGNCVIGFSSKELGSPLRFETVHFNQAVDTQIKRGKVYAAVRYGSRWKACMIETK
jgi:hypothetical protein